MGMRTVTASVVECDHCFENANELHWDESDARDAAIDEGFTPVVDEDTRERWYCVECGPPPVDIPVDSSTDHRPETRQTDTNRE